MYNATIEYSSYNLQVNLCFKIMNVKNHAFCTMTESEHAVSLGISLWDCQFDIAVCIGLKLKF
jgi:hypothetical protein